MRSDVLPAPLSLRARPYNALSVPGMYEGATCVRKDFTPTSLWLPICRRVKRNSDYFLSHSILLSITSPMWGFVFDIPSVEETNQNELLSETASILLGKVITI